MALNGRWGREILGCRILVSKPLAVDALLWSVLEIPDRSRKGVVDRSHTYNWGNTAALVLVTTHEVEDKASGRAGVITPTSFLLRLEVRPHSYLFERTQYR